MAWDDWPAKPKSQISLTSLALILLTSSADKAARLSHSMPSAGFGLDFGI